MLIFIGSTVNGSKITKIGGNTLIPMPGDMERFGIELDLQIPNQAKNVHPNLESVEYDENVANIIQGLDEELYLSYLEELVSYGPRVTATEACFDSGEYIYNEFIEMGLDATIHEWEYSDELYGTNIQATINGANANSDEIYIICAHYDSVPGSPGADDDGSGTIAVLTAAKLMSTYLFNHTVRFVAFSGEEQGLIGSSFYASDSDEKNENIAAVLNVDMIGFAEDEEDETRIKIYENDFSQWITEFTDEVSEEYNEYLNLDVLPSGSSYGSDHASFWEQGYPAIFYAEYNFNDYYHSSEDIIENMNIDYAVRCSRLIIATLAELSEIIGAEAPLQPDRPDGPSSGDARTEYRYSTTAIDPQNDQIYYYFDWGDGKNSGWLGPYNSGETIFASHQWSIRGDYLIRVKAKDIEGHEGVWSDQLSVSMPRNRLIQLKNNLFRLFEKLQQFKFLI